MVNGSPCPHTLLTSTLPGNICQINEMSLQLTYTQSAVEKRCAGKNQTSLNSKHSLFDPKPGSKGSYKYFCLPFFFFFFKAEGKSETKRNCLGEKQKQTNKKTLFKYLQSALSKDLNNLGRQCSTTQESKTHLVQIQASPYFPALNPGQLTHLSEVSVF